MASKKIKVDIDLEGKLTLNDNTDRQDTINDITQVSSATNEHVFTKDTATGNVIFKAAQGGGGSATPLSHGSFYDSTGGQTLNTTGAVVNIDATHSNQGSIFTLSGDVVTVSETGYYLISYGVSVTIQSTTRSGFNLFLQLDTGSGFNTIDGSECHCYGRIFGETMGTASTTIAVSLTAGDEIRLFGQGETLTFITDTNGSMLTIVKLEAPAGANGSDGINGTNGTWQGDWSAGVYAVGDIVRYIVNGNTYWCTQVTTDQVPTNTSYWDLFMEKGVDGEITWAAATGKQILSGTAIDWNTADPIMYKTLTSNTTFTYSNFTSNSTTEGKCMILVLDGDYTVTLPIYTKIISGSYDGTTYNLIQLFGTNSTSASEEVWAVISQEAS